VAHFVFFVFSLIPLVFLFIGSVRQTKAVVSCAIIVYNYFRIWALSMSVCDVTSKMSADEELLLLSAADGSDDFIGST